jgi:hypothetical protein
VSTAALFTESLHPHPRNGWAAPARLAVTGRWQTGPTLALEFTLSGVHPASVRLPLPAPAGPADLLWQHTCFEAFLGLPRGDAYQEYNFSPSGQWAHYRFAAERVRDTAAERQATPRAIPVRCTVQADGLQLLALVPLPAEPATPDGWRLGLSAVLEHADGRLSHWALHHPRPEPDFHHPAGRVLRLPPPLP